MYQDDDILRDFLAGEYRSASALTLGTEEAAAAYARAGDHLGAEIHRLQIDRARLILMWIAQMAPDTWYAAVDATRGL